MTRTPMEMSAYRMAKRRGLRPVDLFLGDWLFGRRGRGSEVRKAHKKVAAMSRESKVLSRRIARHGSTVYE